MDSYKETTAPFLNASGNTSESAWSVSSSRSVTVSSTMFAAGFVGNALALILMATSPVEQKRTLFYKLMFGLALTDLFGTCTTSPVVINIYATGATMESHMPLCHYFSFMLVFAAFATMSVVCAMAVERYICLCHPYFYQCKLPKSYARYALIISWTLSGVIAALPLVGLGRTAAQVPKTWCFFDATSRRPQDRAFNIIFATITLLAIGVTLYCNVAAIYSVLALRKRQMALNASQGPAGTKGRSLAQRFAELHMLVILVGVTIIFTSCFGPLMVFTLICQTDVMSKADVEKTYLLMIRLGSFNPILDPLVYILVRRELRWRIIFMFRCLLRIKNNENPKKGWTPQYPQTPVYNSPIPFENGDGGHRDSCDSVFGNLDSPMFEKSPAPSDADMSFWTFCFHCLCDPPVHRSSNALGRSMASFGSRASINVRRSPMRNLTRNASTDSILNGNRDRNCVLVSQPQSSGQRNLLKNKYSSTPNSIGDV